jgi:hypothetical protein
MRILAVLAAVLLAHGARAAGPVLPTEHTVREIEGWTVRLDNRLLGEEKERGEKAMKLLSARLFAITVVVPEPALSKLRAVTIQLDLNHGILRAAQYHPNAGWLKSNGFSTNLVRCVHIPHVDGFLSPAENHRMPWVLLHELAHAYHDQVLGFEEPRVKAAWQKFKDSGKYAKVLTSQGGLRQHYGETNQKEFFAEMTESYFGSNDFYPFVTGELREQEPDLHVLLKEIWGPHPGYRDPETKTSQ